MLNFIAPSNKRKNQMKLINILWPAVLVGLLASEAVPAQDFSNFEYRNVGPSRGGRVTAVAGTVAAPATFYLGASGGGVWKTEDYGTTWNVVSDGYFESPSIGDIDVAQNDANIVYVGTTATATGWRTSGCGFTPPAGTTNRVRRSRRFRTKCAAISIWGMPTSS
jgi:hypothetical protein